MPRPFRPTASMVAATLAIAGGFAAPAATHAQSTARTGAPVNGTWGAEAVVGRFNDASVLRFVSPSWALLVGGSIQRSEDAGSGSARVPGRTSAQIQAGIRKYHRTSLGLRPITGLGINVGRLSGIASTAGIYGEAGVEYLFNPHLSLGAVGVATVSRDGDQNTFSFLVPRVLASVFF